MIVSLAFLVAGISLGITSWSVRGSDDFRYLGAALGVTREFSHWEMRWPAYALQRIALELFGANPAGIWFGRWLVLGVTLSGIGFLGHVVYGRWAAVWSVILLGVCPILVIPLSQGWIDTVEAGWCSVIIALLFLLYRQNDARSQSWLAALLGIALAMAMLSRITAILVLPAVALTWWCMGRPWRLIAIAALSMAAVLVIDAVYLSYLLGDGLARWRHLGTVEGGYETFGNSDLSAPSAPIRLTYGLPRVLLGGSPIVNLWLTWLLGCGAAIALGFLLTWREARRCVGPLVLATLLGILVLLLLPTPRGTFALRLLQRYYVFAAPLLGVGAVVSLLLLVRRYPRARAWCLAALVSACAFYMGVFLLPQRYYSIPLRDGMTRALSFAQNARTGEVVVTDVRTARLLSEAARVQAWPQLVWIDYKKWMTERNKGDAFILLDVPHGNNAKTDQARSWLLETGGYTLIEVKDYSACTKQALWACVPLERPIMAIRVPSHKSK